MPFGIAAVAAQGQLQLGLQRLFEHVEAHLAGVQLVHVQQVVDQRAQALAVLLGDLQQFVHRLGHFAHDVRADQRQRAGDGRQRRAQLMADGGDELALQAFDALAFGDVVQHDDRAHALAIGGVQRVGVGQYVPRCAIAQQHHLVVDDVLAIEGAAQRNLFGFQRGDAIGAVQPVMAGPFARR